MIYLLHISDLHMIEDPNANNMAEAILDHVEDKLANVPDDTGCLLVITGDFHYYREKDYKVTPDFLDRLIKCMNLSREQDVFVVPGNHDVDKSAAVNVHRRNAIYVLKSQPELLKEQLQAIDFGSFYEGYLGLQEHLGIYRKEEIEDKCPVKTHVRSWRGRLNFLHLNTTLVADGKKDKQLCDVSTATSKEIRMALRKDNIPCFCLGHNSFYDLHKRQQEQLRGFFLQENISAYLCGDRHRIAEDTDEMSINLTPTYSPMKIPNAVCSRSSADEEDNYSDFGIFWHLIDERTGKVTLEYHRWKSENSGKLKLSEIDVYWIRRQGDDKNLAAQSSVEEEQRYPGQLPFDNIPYTENPHFTGGVGQMQKKDFFISYTESDEKWAIWIAGVLETDCYTTYLKAWDFKPGENFILNIHNALIDCERFIAILSGEYMEQVSSQAEWTAAFAKDPNSEKGLFIPVRIDNYEPKGLLQSIFYIDLFGIEKEEIAEEKIKQLTKESVPRNKLGYPGTKKPRFPGQLPFHNIPYTKNLHFTGRKEILNEIKECLKPGQQNPYSYVLFGLGAVGKTQIALAYALNNGYLYDTIWWVHAENELVMLNSYKDLLEQKGIIKKDVTYEKEDIMQSVWAWMSNNANWLFIYDNAESEDELTDYLPRINTGHILITTRNQNWFNINKTKKVDVFKALEAVKFFQSFEIEGSVKDAEKLAEELGYLPLALSQAVAYMLETNRSFQGYLNLFKKYRLKLLEDVKYNSPSNKQTVTTTWIISLNKISNESAKQLIQLFTFLAPAHIQKSMFIQASEYLPEPLASAVKNELKFNNTINDLTRYSLIQTDKGWIRIHRLLQEVIQQSLGNNKNQHFHCCVEILRNLFMYDPYDMKTWENCARLMPRVQSILTHEEDLKTETEEIASLYAQGARWLNHTALYKEAIEWHEKALVIREKVLGPNHPDTAKTHNNIGFIYSRQGKYKEALAWYEKALVICEKVLDFDHPDTATMYNNIAFIYRRQGKYKKALDWYEKALVIREKVLGPDHPDTATTYNDIAGVYNNQGKYKEALDWYEKALAIREKVLGPDHPDTATAYNNIAFIYSRQGKYEKALEWYKKALMIYEKVLGSDHPDTATPYHNIAFIYSRQGKYEKALEWYEKALVIREKVLGPDHPDTAAMYNNIAGVYNNQGKYKEALEWYEKALVIREKVLEPDHPSTAATYHNIAGVYNNQDKYKEALKWYEKALVIREKVLGPDHPDTVDTHNKITRILKNRVNNSGF